MDDRVFAVGYRPHERRGAPQAPWRPIARTLLVLAWRRRATKIALLVCAAVALGAGFALVGQVLMERFNPGSIGLSPQAIVGSAGETLSIYLRTQFYFTAIALAAIAGGCVADDRAAGAFELYFARPLTVADYAWGKLLGAGAVPLVTLIVPALVLWLVAAGISPPDVSGDLWRLGLPTLLGAALAAVVLTTTIVGLSAMGQKGRTVGVAYVTGLIVLAMIGTGLDSAGFELGGYLVPERNLRTVVDALLQVGAPSVFAQVLGPRRFESNEDVVLSLVALIALSLAGLGLLRYRLGREVVA